MKQPPCRQGVAVRLFLQSEMLLESEIIAGGLQEMFELALNFQGGIWVRGSSGLYVFIVPWYIAEHKTQFTDLQSVHSWGWNSLTEKATGMGLLYPRYNFSMLMETSAVSSNEDYCK